MFVFQKLPSSREKRFQLGEVKARLTQIYLFLQSIIKISWAKLLEHGNIGWKSILYIVDDIINYLISINIPSSMQSWNSFTALLKDHLVKVKKEISTVRRWWHLLFHTLDSTFYLWLLLSGQETPELFLLQRFFFSPNTFHGLQSLSLISLPQTYFLFYCMPLSCTCPVKESTMVI